MTAFHGNFLGERMAKLYFYYSAMNAGKTTTLLQSSYNYREMGMDTILFVPSVDTMYGEKIVSRIGLNSEAISFDNSVNLFKFVKNNKTENLKCVLVDESQFLSKKHVFELTEIVDTLDIPVLAYGLRTDFMGELFEGSKYLLAWADCLVELKTICRCGRKATMNLRITESGSPIQKGTQIQIGGNESYVSVCRKHYKEHCQMIK